MPGPLRNGARTGLIGVGFLKNPRMANARMPQFSWARYTNGRISPGDGVTLGDADFRKSLVKMIYRKLSKTASPSVTCHPRSVTLGNDFSHTPMMDK
jgi:hypothetical protein